MIDIGTVLKHLDDTVDEHTLQVKEYGLRFITADGRLRTLIGRKNVKSPKQGKRAPLDPRGGITWNLKRNSTLLMHDNHISQPRAIKVPTIVQFKHHGSNVWHKVFH